MAELGTHQCVRDDLNVCQLCGELENLSLCGACKGVWYCSKSHQRQDWKIHKTVCKRVEKNVTARTNSETVNKEKEKEEKSPVQESPSEKMVALENSVDDNDKVHSSIMSRTNEKEKQTFDTEENGFNYNFKSSQDDDKVANVQSSTKKRQPASSEESPKHFLKRDSKVLDSKRQQRYYLKETTQTLSLPPSLSELSNDKNQNSKPNKKGALEEDTTNFSTLGRREQYLLILQSRFNEVSKYVVKCLTQYGICVVDKFLGEAMVQDILKEVLRIQASGVMNQGQLVSGPSSSSKNKHIRGDEITWMDGTEAHCENIHHLISCMDTVMLQGAKDLPDCVINERTKVSSVGENDEAD